MASLCEAWDIPYLNLSEIPNSSEIESKVDAEDPKIILSSIEDISNPVIQSQLQIREVSYIAIDEAQVCVDCFLEQGWTLVWENTSETECTF